MTQVLQDYREYLRLMGHHVVQSETSLWIDVRPRVFQPTPPFNLAPISKKDIRQLFRSSKALACRWFTTNKSDSKNASVLYVARSPYNISTLPHRARHQTRRGLERVQVRRITMDDDVERLAFEVYKDNVTRLGLFKRESELNSRWATWVNAIRHAPGLELWAAWKGAEMGAFAVTVETPWGTEFVLTRNAKSMLALYPNNALIYTVTRNALDRGSPLVSMGLSSFSGEGDGLHRFKINMGYEAVQLNQQSAWHPFLRPFASLLRQQRLENIHRLLTRFGGHS